MNVNTVSASRRSLLRAGLGGGVLLGSGSLSALLTGCSASDPVAKTAAKVSAAAVRAASGEVNVLTFSFYQPKDLNTGTVKGAYSTVATADEILAKVRSRSTPLGVVNTGANLMRELYTTNRLVPISTDAMSRYGDVAQSLREDPVFSRDGEVYAVPFAVSPGLTAWDSDKVPEPTSADQLLGSEYRDQISAFDDAETLLIIHRALGGDLAVFTKDDLDAVLSYMEDLRPNIKTLHTFGQEVDLLGRGDIGVALPTYGSLLTAARDANPAIKGNTFASMSYVDCWSVAEGADLAKALNWIDHSLESAGQQALQTASGGYPAVADEVDFSQLPTELDGIALDDWLTKSAVAVGVPVEAEDDLVTRQVLQQAWNQYKTGF